MTKPLPVLLGLAGNTELQWEVSENQGVLSPRPPRPCSRAFVPCRTPGLEPGEPRLLHTRVHCCLGSTFTYLTRPHPPPPRKRLLGCLPSFAMSASLIFKTFLLLRFSSQAEPPSWALCAQRHPWVAIHTQPSCGGRFTERLQPRRALLRALSTLRITTPFGPAPKPRLGIPSQPW